MTMRRKYHSNPRTNTVGTYLFIYIERHSALPSQTTLNQWEIVRYGDVWAHMENKAIRTIFHNS